MKQPEVSEGEMCLVARVVTQDRESVSVCCTVKCVGKCTENQVLITSLEKGKDEVTVAF